MAPATLTAGTLTVVSLSSATPRFGGLYPDSPFAYPDLCYPDQVGTGVSLSEHAVDPVTLTAA